MRRKSSLQVMLMPQQKMLMRRATARALGAFAAPLPAGLCAVHRRSEGGGAAGSYGTGRLISGVAPPGSIGTTYQVYAVSDVASGCVYLAQSSASGLADPVPVVTAGGGQRQPLMWTGGLEGFPQQFVAHAVALRSLKMSSSIRCAVSQQSVIMASA